MSFSSFLSRPESITRVCGEVAGESTPWPVPGHIRVSQVQHHAACHQAVGAGTQHGMRVRTLCDVWVLLSIVTVKFWELELSTVCESEPHVMYVTFHCHIKVLGAGTQHGMRVRTLCDVCYFPLSQWSSGSLFWNKQVLCIHTTLKHSTTKTTQKHSNPSHSSILDSVSPAIINTMNTVINKTRQACLDWKCWQMMPAMQFQVLDISSLGHRKRILASLGDRPHLERDTSLSPVSADTGF